MKIGPARTLQELKDSGQITAKRQSDPPPELPGTLADAWQMSPNDKYQENRRLADEIGKLVQSIKGTSPDGKPLFVIGWRLYPNKENTDYWKDAIDEHVCSCSCGCACLVGP